MTMTDRKDGKPNLLALEPAIEAPDDEVVVLAEIILRLAKEGKIRSLAYVAAGTGPGARWGQAGEAKYDIVLLGGLSMMRSQVEHLVQDETDPIARENDDDEPDPEDA